MNINWNVSFIDPQNLLTLTRNDKTRMLKYLNQFLELIPSRVESLKNSMRTEDRKMIRQILHQMSPQLQFFGIPGVVIGIRRMEHEYETISIEELNRIVNDILLKLEGATKDIEMVLNNNF